MRSEALRPETSPLEPESGRRLPLFAFDLLRTGDAFEVFERRPPANGRARATEYANDKLLLDAHGVSAALESKVRDEVVQQLEGNPQLVDRLAIARPIRVDIVPSGRQMASLGFPKHASAGASGLFWDHPTWPHARIGLLAQALENERALMIHEMAHAIARLAFTQKEQDDVYQLMLPTYGTRGRVDEVFAIYSEREFLDAFTEREAHAPGVYGLARQRWDERHVFTRFVRALYFPYKPLAGGTAPSAHKGRRMPKLS
ncbi:MAG: hypothetical protein ACKVPX_18410 [Myxococcaceae bacterium]